MWLALLFVFFLMLSIALFIVWAVTSDGFSNLGKQSNVCSSRQCIHTGRASPGVLSNYPLAFRMSSYMDDTVPPCDNFYRYSCGKFHALTRDKQLNFLDQQREATARSVYGEKTVSSPNFSGLVTAAPDVGQRSERLVKAVYSACMDAPAR